MDYANDKNRRSERPWIVVLSHRPFYSAMPAPDTSTVAEYGNFTEIENILM